MTQISDDTRVAVASTQAKRRLQDSSLRRAVVNRIIDAKGSMTCAELDSAFGFDVRSTVRSLVRDSWLEIVA